MNFMSRSKAVVLWALALGLVSGSYGAGPTPEQGVYLPIYSHVYVGDVDKQGQPDFKLLSAHVSIRNTDAKNSIQILAARYYDTGGNFLKNYVPSPVTIPALGTVELFVPRNDTSGGSGANFLITWRADAKVQPPLIEALHASLDMSRTLTFITSGRVLEAK